MKKFTVSYLNRAVPVGSFSPGNYTTTEIDIPESEYDARTFAAIQLSIEVERIVLCIPTEALPEFLEEMSKVEVS